MLPTEKEYMELRQIAWNLRNELDNVINERDVLKNKLDIALTDLHDTTAQLIMDEGVRDALAASCNERELKVIAYDAIRQDAEAKLDDWSIQQGEVNDNLFHETVVLGKKLEIAVRTINNLAYKYQYDTIGTICRNALAEIEKVS